MLQPVAETVYLAFSEEESEDPEKFPVRMFLNEEGDLEEIDIQDREAIQDAIEDPGRIELDAGQAREVLQLLLDWNMSESLKHEKIEKIRQSACTEERNLKSSPDEADSLETDHAVGLSLHGKTDVLLETVSSEFQGPYRAEGSGYGLPAVSVELVDQEIVLALRPDADKKTSEIYLDGQKIPAETQRIPLQDAGYHTVAYTIRNKNGSIVEEDAHAFVMDTLDTPVKKEKPAEVEEQKQPVIQSPSISEKDDTQIPQVKKQESALPVQKYQETDRVQVEASVVQPETAQKNRQEKSNEISSSVSRENVPVAVETVQETQEQPDSGFYERTESVRNTEAVSDLDPGSQHMAAVYKTPQNRREIISATDDLPGVEKVYFSMDHATAQAPVQNRLENSEIWSQKNTSDPTVQAAESRPAAQHEQADTQKIRQKIETGMAADFPVAVIQSGKTGPDEKLKLIQSDTPVSSFSGRTELNSHIRDMEVSMNPDGQIQIHSKAWNQEPVFISTAENALVRPGENVRLYLNEDSKDMAIFINGQPLEPIYQQDALGQSYVPVPVREDTTIQVRQSGTDLEWKYHIRMDKKPLWIHPVLYGMTGLLSALYFWMKQSL